MDCNNDDGRSKQWELEAYCFPQDSNYDVTDGLWNGVSQNKDDVSYMFDGETTPVKACGDLEYHIGHSGRSVNKEAEECRESFSQVKRRRMLLFPDGDSTTLCREEMSTEFLKSNERRVESIEGLPETPDWLSDFAENISASGYETLDPTSDGWIADCFNDAEMHFGPDDLNCAEASNFQIDISEFCETAPVYQNNVPKQRPTSSGNIIFKGRKSFIRAPTKLASSVAYPFAFIKPSGAHGDVTLKDINQRILTPPPSKSKQNNEDPNVAYPTSAFSGKPVVGKTKIRTEGGKGSITIMRTKG
ncbi:hypothetical protein UlMin_031859 [Ulmus minor]